MADTQPEWDPTLRAIGPEDVDEKVLNMSLFHRGMLDGFIFSLKDGNMPGGKRTNLPLFPITDMMLFNSDYKDWAVEPFRSMPERPRMLGGPPAPAAILRVAMAISGLDQIIELGLQGLLRDDRIERSFAKVKALLWIGMPPMSDAQWKAKGLDERDNIEEAMATIKQVIEVFKYLRSPEIQGRMSTTHNRTWVEIDFFQDALNALYQSRGQARPAHSLTLLWEEFIDCHMDFMEKQARAWVFRRLKGLWENIQAHFQQKFASGRRLNATQVTIKINFLDMEVMPRLVDMYLDADCLVRAPTSGFIVMRGQLRQQPDLDLSEEYRRLLYADYEENRVKQMREIVQQQIEMYDEAVSVEPWAQPPFMKEPVKVINRYWAHHNMQPEIGNPRVLRMETWVAKLAKDDVQKFGFVIYRLAYNESDGSWDSLLQKFNDGAASGWEGVIGADSVQHKAHFHWIDGRDAMIAEGDLNAARLHFKELTQKSSFPSEMTKLACLAITPNGMSSFQKFTSTSTSSSASTTDNNSTNHNNTHSTQIGDFHPFIHVLDPSFAPPTNPSSASRPPFSTFTSTSTSTPPTTSTKDTYTGTFKITIFLLYTDLLAHSIIVQSQKFVDYWEMSRLHPWGVYVGPSTAVARRKWREMRGGALLGLWEMFNRGGFGVGGRR